MSILYNERRRSIAYLVSTAALFIAWCYVWTFIGYLLHRATM